MIVPMKKVSVIVQTHDRNTMLRSLRKAGVMHIDDKGLHSPKSDELKRMLDSLQQVRSAIMERQTEKRKEAQQTLSDEVFFEAHNAFLAKLDRRKKLGDRIAKDRAAIERIAPWGDFDPADLAYLEAHGVSLFFYTLTKKAFAALDPSLPFIPLDAVDGKPAIAMVGTKLDDSQQATPLQLPEAGLGELQKQVASDEAEIVEIDAALKEGNGYLDAYALRIRRQEQALRFDAVAAGMDGGDDLCWVTGFLPVTKKETFESLASDGGWGYVMDDPEEEDNPPTLVKYPKGFGIIKPLFDLLGTVPGYREYDISVWFLLFFTLFFAMIISDAGYGLIFLLLAAGLHIKQKKASTAIMLTYVLSIATVIWGSLTGTWFGSEKILTSVPFLQHLVIPSIANYPALFGGTAVASQNAVMKFCFMIGTLHLSLACVLNVVHKIGKKDLSFVADLGWLMDILALYFVVLQLVVGEQTDIAMAFRIVGVGFVLVCLFGAQKPGQSFLTGVVHGLAGLFTTFLDTISCFSNIMSYIRLFAVGMATLAIAQSFNSIAGDLMGGFTTIIGIVVVLLGHSLNLVMGLLSVIVHGVRLNLLEFSGQLGMEWTGIAYEPFAQTVQEN